MKKIQKKYNAVKNYFSINFYCWVKKFKIKVPVSLSLITIIVTVLCVSAC